MKNLTAKNNEEKMTSPLRSDPSGHTTADICKGFATFSSAIATENVRYRQTLAYHFFLHITLPSFLNRIYTPTIVLAIDIVFCSIFYWFLESSIFTKWDIEKLDTIFFCIFMSNFEEFFEIFFWTGIKTRCIKWDF